MTALKSGDSVPISHAGGDISQPDWILSERAAGTRWKVLLLIASILLVYFPAYRCGFVFDDRIYVTENEQVQDPNGLDDLWTSHSAYAYYPLTMTTFWLEYRLWGLSPLGYHVDNVLLHAGSAVLFFLILRSLALPGAFLAALLFGLHPVCVESVAWVSERKNVLSQFFVLLSILLWIRYENGKRTRTYVFSLFCFALSLLAKITTAPAPVLLLLISWWKDGKDWRQRIVPLAPFVLVALSIGSICLWTERNISEAHGAEYEIPFAARWAIAGKAFFFYLGKLLWPLDSMAIYPRWEIRNLTFLSSLYPLSAFLFLLGLFFLRSRIGKGPFTAMALYLLALFPSLGFVDFAYMRLSFVADHFQYFACLAPFAGVGFFLSTRLPPSAGMKAPIAGGALILPIALLGCLTWNQCSVYRDDLTLFSDNVARNPEGVGPRDHLAKVLVEKGEFAAAYDQYKEGVERNPDSALLRFGLAMSAAQQGRVELALRHLRETLVLDPDHAGAHHNLAVALGRLGKPEVAERHFRRTLELDPVSLPANRDYASYLMERGRNLEAVEAFSRCLELDPKDAPSYFNLGLVLADSNRFEEAIDRFEQALEYAPDQAGRIAPLLARAHRSLGVQLKENGNREAAVKHLEKSLDLWPRTVHYRAEIAATRSFLEKIGDSKSTSPVK
jgi:tetratricopeptide (TPR) repeat protein